MKNIVLLLALLSCVVSSAQVTPQYYIDRHDSLFTPPVANWAFYTFNGGSAGYQSLILRDSFTTAKPPFGRVRNVYVRRWSDPFSTCYITNIRIALGFTSLQNFDSVYDSVFTHLTNLAFVDTLKQDTTPNSWIKIPVETTFFVDTGYNLIFDISVDTGSYIQYGFCGYMASFFGGKIPSPSHYYLNLVDWHDSSWAGGELTFLDFGFDLYPTGLELLQNLQDLRVYPNPATTKVVFSAGMQHPARDASLTIFDLQGRKVFEQHLPQVGENFYAEVDVSGFAKGVYVAELRAEGERVVQRLVVQ